ncbi:OmpA family protein [Thermithiobacillus tepidarius DSM 3134]|uniref:OmpA family protein n=1 Tax=Thermithiobacillus tepidarius TaxID=929 RepID=UPI000421BEB6|nr:OmpA family protein [Thermithiobacillus tepidarius]
MALNNSVRNRGLALLVAGTLGLAGCATTPGYERTQQGAVIGTLGGAAAGAVIGNQSGNPRTGAVIGAAVGGLLGAGIGRYLDNQQRELEQRLAAERAANEVNIQRVNNGQALNVTMNSQAFFRFGTAEIVGDGHRILDNVADVLNRYPESRVTITGHTDSVGDAAFNQRLSQQRAQAVMSYLASRGVASSRMVAQGMGESNPIASNGTEAGRQLNRRVEILITPTAS